MAVLRGGESLAADSNLAKARYEETHNALERGKTKMCRELDELIKNEGGVFVGLHTYDLVGEDSRKSSP